MSPEQLFFSEVLYLRTVLYLDTDGVWTETCPKSNLTLYWKEFSF